MRIRLYSNVRIYNHRLCDEALYRFRVIESYLSKVAYYNLPHAPEFGTPVGGDDDPVRISPRTLWQPTRQESLDYRVALLP